MGQPLFQFDRRPYEYKVRQISAQLAEAKQNVSVLKLDVEVATQNSNKARIELAYQQYQKRMFDKLAQKQAVREEDVEQKLTQTNAAPSDHGRDSGGTRSRSSQVQIRNRWR
jgi:multidrug resistance efflux pump